MKLFELKKEYEIFVDLDGVMANLDKYVKDRTGMTFLQLRATGDGFTDFVQGERDEGRTVFDQLEMMPDAQTLWDFVKPHNPAILTATGYPKEKAAAEKIRWVHANLDGFTNILTVSSGTEKQQYAAPNHILIDDREKSILPWRNAGGIGILHTSAESTIDQLQRLGL